MTNPCGYCDEIENALVKATDEMDTFTARQRLTNAGLGDIIKKLDNKQTITDAEFNQLWEPANREYGIKVMESAGRNMVEEITEKAIKSGDELEILKTKNEITNELKQCIIKGTCEKGFNVKAALIGIGAIATAATLMNLDTSKFDKNMSINDTKQELIKQIYGNNATTGNINQTSFLVDKYTGNGTKPINATTLQEINRKLNTTTTYIFDPVANQYIEATLIKTPYEKIEREMVRVPFDMLGRILYFGQEVPIGIKHPYETLANSGLFLKYGDEGAIPRAQGTAIDPLEYMCQQFAMDGVEEIRKAGDNAHVVGLYGRYTQSGKDKFHAMIAIEDPTREYLYTIDPSAGFLSDVPKNIDYMTELKEKISNPLNYTPIIISRIPKTIISMPEYTLVDPSSGGLVKETNNNLVGQLIGKGKRQYEIIQVSIIGDNPIVKTTSVPPPAYTAIIPVGDSNVISQTKHTPQILALEKEDPRWGYNIWDVTGTNATLRKNVPD